MTTAWTAADVARIDLAGTSRVPMVERADRSKLAPGQVYWDMWPVQDAGGRKANIAGGEMWMALAAPDRGDPALRHFEARIRWLERYGGEWFDLGPVLPDFPVPYEREWSGSALADERGVTLFLTGAGTVVRPGGYQQRLFESFGTVGSDGMPRHWTPPRTSLRTFGPWYMPADAHEGAAGRIKAMRDPAYFRDPADGAEYLIFTASLAGSSSDYNGAVGIARRSADGWVPLPPLLHADMVNNELERAHVVFHHGRYYLFWVTQRTTFAPELRRAPTGLYGMVADSLTGTYRPLNGSGLVLANPDAAPAQCYSWFVSAELEVSSFVDMLGNAPVTGPTNETRFGGVPAPLLRLSIDGDRCQLAQEVAA